MMVVFESGASESRPAVRPRANHVGHGVWWRFIPRLTALGFLRLPFQAASGRSQPLVSTLRPCVRAAVSVCGEIFLRVGEILDDAREVVVAKARPVS